MPRIRKHTCRRWPQSVRVRRTTITPENERYRPIWSYRFVSVERPAMSSIRHGDATVFSAAWPMPVNVLTSPSSVAASRLLNDCVTVRTHPTFDLSRRRFACSPAEWRSRKFSTGGASICSVPFCPSPFSCPTKSAVQSKKRHDLSYRLNDWTNSDKQLGFTRRPITLRNHIPKKYVFSWRPLRHLYGYATVAYVRTPMHAGGVHRPAVQQYIDPDSYDDRDRRVCARKSATSDLINHLVHVGCR